MPSLTEHFTLDFVLCTVDEAPAHPVKDACPAECEPHSCGINPVKKMGGFFCFIFFAVKENEGKGMITNPGLTPNYNRCPSACACG
jgi:hypothetical protein